MADCFITRRGGGGGMGGLNFSVVGGTTEPRSPKENTIWVNTDNEITDWMLSTTQPDDSEGRVWISTSTESKIAFNALKKNGIQVYVISAKQYVSGEWVNKDAKIYQGDKWVDWLAGELFASGQGQIVPFTLTAQSGSGLISATNESVEFSFVYKSGAVVTMSTMEPIDLTNYNTLTAEVMCTETHHEEEYTGRLIVSSSPSLDSNVVAYTVFTADSQRKTYSVNVANLSGEYYVGVWGVVKATLYNMKLNR